MRLGLVITSLASAALVLACSSSSQTSVAPSPASPSPPLTEADASQMGMLCLDVSFPEGSVCGYDSKPSECSLGVCVADGRTLVLVGGSMRNPTYCSVDCGKFACPAGWECAANTVPDVAKVCAKVPTTCGDGAVEGEEVCDDGNTLDGDGCSKDCAKVLPARVDVTSLSWSSEKGSAHARQLTTPLPNPYVRSKDELTPGLWADVRELTSTMATISIVVNTFEDGKTTPPSFVYLQTLFSIPRASVKRKMAANDGMIEHTNLPLIAGSSPFAPDDATLEVRATSDSRTLDVHIKGSFVGDDVSKTPIDIDLVSRIVLPPP